MKQLKMLALMVLVMQFSNTQTKTDWSFFITPFLIPLSSLIHTFQFTPAILDKIKFVTANPRNHTENAISRLTCALIAGITSYGIYKGFKYAYKNFKELFAKYPKETKKALLSVLASYAVLHGIPVAIVALGNAIVPGAPHYRTK